MQPSVKSSSDVPKNYIGIVSPCSTCANNRSSPENGLPACPRYSAIANAQELQNAGFSTTAMEILTLTGNEDNPSSSSNGLVNPVYSSTYNGILVWVAALNDNTGVYDSNGNQLCPDIRDPNFDTNYIVCRSQPSTPIQPEAEYFGHGGWKEWDQVNVITTPIQQMVTDPNATDSSATIGAPIEGSVKKVNLAYYYPQIPPIRDHAVIGT